jgi:hypothetical protein
VTTPSVDGKENFPIRWPSRCGKIYNVNTEEMVLDSIGDLNIVESVHQLDGPYRRVIGWIHIAQAPSDQAPGTFQIKMSYAVSPSVDITSVKYAWTSSGLTMGDPTFPDGYNGFRKGDACLGISITVYVPPGTSLENLYIKSSHLGMQIHDGVNFAVNNRTSISLTTGTLDSAPFNSRETHLETISGSISGKYSLFDLVSIVTKSGSVNVNIEPKEALPGSSRTATFLAKSLSGSIRADYERKDIPERDYQIAINTTVGSIDGTFIHGSKTALATVAGMIAADVLPFKSGGYSSLFSTQTMHGQTEVKLRSPYKASGVPMTRMNSVHTSISGILDLAYPQEWSGHLKGTSTEGRLKLQGADLELVEQDAKPGFNMAEATKGPGQSNLVFGTTSGEVDVKVGTL